MESRWTALGSEPCFVTPSAFLFGPRSSNKAHLLSVEGEM